MTPTNKVYFSTELVNGFLCVAQKLWPMICLVAMLSLLGTSAFASELAESACEEDADDLKRIAYWMIIGGVLTTPIGIGALILPIGGFLWLVAEVWWGLC